MWIWLPLSFHKIFSLDNVTLAEGAAMKVQWSAWVSACSPSTPWCKLCCCCLWWRTLSAVQRHPAGRGTSPSPGPQLFTALPPFSFSHAGCQVSSETYIILNPYFSSPKDMRHSYLQEATADHTSLVPRHSGQALVASRALYEGAISLWILLLDDLNKS